MACHARAPVRFVSWREPSATSECALRPPPRHNRPVNNSWRCRGLGLGPSSMWLCVHCATPMHLRRATLHYVRRQRPSAKSWSASRKLAKRAGEWQPWRAYASMYLWKSLSLSEDPRRELNVKLCRTTIESPVGPLELVADDSNLLEIAFEGRSQAYETVEEWAEGSRLLIDVQRQLGEYFESKRNQFELPLAPQGTEFQGRVWKALLTIPYGETISYKQLAVRIDQPAPVVRSAYTHTHTHTTYLVFGVAVWESASL